MSGPWPAAAGMLGLDAGAIVAEVATVLTAISAYWLAAGLALLFFGLRRQRDLLNALLTLAGVWLLLRALGAILRLLVPCIAPHAESSFGFVVALTLAVLLPLRLWQRLLCLAIVAAMALSRSLALGCGLPRELALAAGLVALGVALFWLLGHWMPARQLWQRAALAVDDWSSARARTELTPTLLAVLAARLRQHQGFVTEDVQPVGARGVHASTPVVVYGRAADGRPQRYFAKIITTTNWQSGLVFELGDRLAARGKAHGPIWPSLKLLVEHEHYMLLLFQRLGVLAPQPHGVFRLERRVYALVTDYLEGVQTLRELGEVSAGYVGQALRALQRLRQADCTHGDIKASNLVLLPGDRFAFVDLALAQYVAGRRRLARDLADMLVVLAMHHDPEAVVAMAREVIGDEGLRQACAYLHRRRLNVETRQMAPLELPRELRRLIAAQTRR